MTCTPLVELRISVTRNSSLIPDRACAWRARRRRRGRWAARRRGSGPSHWHVGLASQDDLTGRAVTGTATTVNITVTATPGGTTRAGDHPPAAMPLSMSRYTAFNEC